MKISNHEHSLKALKLLVAEFSNTKYGSFVNKEIEELETGIKDRIGFQSESSDVILEIKLNGCAIDYNYWDKELDTFVKGNGKLNYKTVINKIYNVTRTNHK